MKDSDMYERSVPSLSTSEETDPLLSTPSTPKPDQKTQATPWHIIIPVFALTFGMGALVAPLVQFYTEIFCDMYYRRSEGDAFDFTGGVAYTDMRDCAIPEVQVIVSRVQGIVVFLLSGSSLLMAPFYGSLSDRYGRRVVFQIFGLGGILQMLCYVGVAKLSGDLAFILFILAPLVRGFLVGEMILLAAIQAYVSDCTTHEARTIAMGRMMSAVFLGIALGPMVSSVFVKEYGSVTPLFYFLLVIDVLFFVYVTFWLPESLDQGKMLQARRNSQQQEGKVWHKLNIFSAMSILFTSRPAHMNRWTVPLLALIHFLIAMLGQPPTLLYAMLQFKWTAVEGGLLISVSSFIRLIIMVAVLPSAFAYAKRHFGIQENETSPSSARILVDLLFVRFGMAVEAICFVLAAMATTSLGFSAALALQSVGILAQPSLRSLYTSLVPASQIGELLGAQAVLDSIALMISQTGLNFIYSLSVKTFPSLFIYILAMICGLCVVAACFIHPVDPSASYSPIEEEEEAGRPAL
ncbi:MFS general substrate transporter [Hesseltinella vesiculosa]|uniref:MFS general substrate transporter n=1 Tax=Hesseltinella vesiculosa TaxID=101127 RepID=A0A1X2GP69_9FUNG|nr:MFS general substrate transporter [Hesseltinella vesiculosa]